MVVIATACRGPLFVWSPVTEYPRDWAVNRNTSSSWFAAWEAPAEGFPSHGGAFLKHHSMVGGAKW